jgi:hypothetical protein
MKEKKPDKTQITKEVFGKLSEALIAYKAILGKKKLERRLEKTSKQLGSDIARSLKKAHKAKLKMSGK